MGQPLNIWDKIQQGVRETERSISQKDYNKAIIQARQTLEAMVRFLGNRACIVESDLAATIDPVNMTAAGLIKVRGNTTQQDPHYRQ